MSEAPLVTVRGEAHLEGPPDLATFTVTAHRSGNTADVVRAALATTSTQVSELLSTLDAALERTSTPGLHVAPVFRRGSEARVQGFRGTFTTEIVVKDFDALSSIVHGLAPVADSQIDGPYWSLRPDNPLYRQARLAAIADARSRADDYALAFASTVVDLVEISDLEGGFSGPRGMRAAAFGMAHGADEPPEFQFEPPLQTVSGQVSVRFTISPPDLSAS